MSLASKTRNILLISCLFLFGSSPAPAENDIRNIHVFVALCDNKNQGVVPVPERLGDGDRPETNLYWGARYGVKAFFKRNNDWKLLLTFKNPKDAILERCVFKHKGNHVYLVADAYMGRCIKKAISHFIVAASGGNKETLEIDRSARKHPVKIGGHSNLIGYIGHNGLMDFELAHYPVNNDGISRHVIILACLSKQYFGEPLRKANATPLLWTTGLMAPEAYTLESAIKGWIRREGRKAIRLRAAKAYSRYQNCGLRKAKNLLVSGF
jgi:hypothetical protein